MTSSKRNPGARYLIASRGITAGHGLVLLDTTNAVDVQTLGTAEQLSSLARHPHGEVVYGTAGMSTPGRVLAWRVFDDGRAVLLADESAGVNEVEPCHVVVDPAGRLVAVANYTSSEIALWPLEHDGSFAGGPTRVPLVGNGPDALRQEAAHPHHIHLAVADSGLLMHVVDLGSDLVRVFEIRFDDRALTTVQEVASHAVPAGTGPRHMVFLPHGRVALTGELASTLVVGSLGDDWHVQSSTRESGPVTGRMKRNYPGDIQRSADGAFVYLANRGYDTVSVFDVLADTPTLVAEVASGVAWPQHLLVEHDALLVAGWDSSAIAHLPLTNGLPGDPTLIPVPSPGWILPI